MSLPWARSAGQESFWEYIASFKGEKTILLTTHYMEEADFLSDNIAVMDSGKIAAMGSSLDLKTLSMDKHTIIINAWNMTRKLLTIYGQSIRRLKLTETACQSPANAGF
jgi:ABC-type multidrug transport system ATPase subunit